MTKKDRRSCFTGAAVAFALTAFFAVPGAADQAFAAGNANGTTEIEVGVAVETIDTVSYDVPLYYVLCVANDTDTRAAEVILPQEDSYYIKNISQQRKVAVTGLSVSSVPGADWSLADTIDPTDSTSKVIHMTVGGVSLPALAAGAADSQSADIIPQAGQTGNTFYKDGKYQLIKQDVGLVIPVTAEVSEAYQVPDAADGKTAAQFRLNYQVSPVDENGNILKADYDGPAPTP